MQNHIHAALTALIREYYRPKADFDLQPISKGLENQNFASSLDGRQVVLRLYSYRHSTTGLRCKAEIAGELDFCAHVREYGVPAPAAIPTHQGEEIATVTIGGLRRFAVLFEGLPGEEAPSYSDGRALAMAELLLKMRQASLAYRKPALRAWPGDMVALSLDFYRANRLRLGRLQAALDPLYAQAAAAYQRLTTENLPTGLIHGDIKLENTLWHGDTLTALLDFDDYRETYLLEELARTLLHDLESTTRNTIRSGYYPVFQAMWAAHPYLAPAELAHLDTFLRARFIYDLTNYSIQDNQELITALFDDPHIAAVILSP